MQLEEKDFEFLVGDFNVLKNAEKTSVLPMFCDEMMDLLADLSNEIFQNEKIREYADVSSYAYWIRRASLKRKKEAYTEQENRLGRGVAFHIAPSNVPVNFAVSMTSSVLAGNVTIVRVSSKSFPQVAMICDALARVIEEKHVKLKPYFCLVRYEHNERINRELSALCDIRIVWGGDQTIKMIQKFPMPARAVEMNFADRYSIAVINAEEYLRTDSPKAARDFYMDTYYIDQNACSSPSLVVWIGENIEKAREKFWKELENLVVHEYQMSPIQAVDKYTSFCELSMKYPGVSLVSDNNFVVRLELDCLLPEMMEYKNGGGYFFEYKIRELKELTPILGKKCQTVSVLGVSAEDVRRTVFEEGVKGVDRIVPLGQTMELEFIWDGYPMIENMTRIVYISQERKGGRGIRNG
ncbi:MAG: long-chain-fatty-acyl-CoA reductase [Lachnospiraceae bacterium]|nr:long-chain-fatty-acyl-CoA reductase [Lachnospiraceae bacterium]